MRKLIFIFATFYAVCSIAAVTCDDSGASSNLNKAGSVITQISPMKCAGDSKQCFEQYHKDRDHCADEKTVVKYSCANGAPVAQSVACRAGTHCKDGACK
jgi:hypothetical protein